MNIRNIVLAVASAALIALAPAASAQSARQIMDKTASVLKSAGGIKASYSATSFRNNTAIGQTSGDICISGRKFRTTAGKNITWFNGTTQWAYNGSSEEVYVSTPTESELQGMNPYVFVDLYKSGYTLSVSNTTYAKRACYEVKMKGKKGKSIRQMLVTIDKQTNLPVCIRMLQSNNIWLRLQVYGISTHQSWSASFFQFDKTKYPKAEVVDLR